MTLTITHAKNVTIADDAVAKNKGEVLPSDWNANHTIAGTIDSSIGGRTILTGNTNYYVRTDGSDSNNGLSNTAAGAFATPQHAMNVIGSTLDFAGFIVTINIGTGTFVGIQTIGCIGGGTLNIQGAGSALTTFTTTSPTDNPSCVYVNSAATPVFVINGMTLSIDLAGAACITLNKTVFGQIGDIDFATADLVFKNTSGGSSSNAITINAPATLFVGSATGFTISGTSWNTFWSIQSQSFVFDFGTFVVTGSPTFTSEFAFITGGSVYDGSNGASYSGAATGSRYNLTGGSVVIAVSNNANFFPGNTAGSVDPSSSYEGFSGHIQASGAPTTTQFPIAGTGGLYKDTSGGAVYIVYNDAGTIKKVALT